MRQHRHTVRSGGWLGRQPGDDTRQQHQRQHHRAPAVDALVPLHEEHADGYAGGHQQHQHRPVVRVLVEHAVVIAQHGHQHRQAEPGVVHAALLATRTKDGVGLLAGAHLRDDLLLARDDPVRDVGGHHRRQRGADEQEGRPAGEELAGHPARHDDEHRHHREHPAVMADLAVGGAAEHAAGGVVHAPAHRQEGQRRRHRLPGRPPGEHARVDQHLAGVGQVEHDEEREAAHPRPVALPIEPVQLLGQVARRHQVLLRVVEAAAMHGPEFAVHALGLQVVGSGLDEVVVEPDEVKRRAYPGDRGDDMQPAQQQVGPVEQIDVHRR
mmetsp:Transcript_65315/g.154306  ORF Transcript_65315/g.154306 Transcript_65315/m.154306 type:complete len:325 (+) Transcript_65315:516-1490(+)